MKKILFIQYGIFSHINESLHHQFKIQFPEYELEIYDVEVFIKTLRLKRILAFLYTLKYYGIDFLTRKKSRYEYVTWEIYTPYINKIVKQDITKKVRNSKDYIFTFQTQSMTDCSTGIIPHFLYTDSTILSLFHNPDFSKKTFHFNNKWIEIEKEFYSNASHCFTFSTNQEKSIIEQYNVEKKHVSCVFAGSNIQVQNNEIEKTYNNNILFVGVNWERKGGPVLLRAFQKVIQDIPDAKLYILGVSKEYILQFEKEDLLENCICLGRLPKEEIVQYFIDSSVFCMPTRNEPFGIAFIEAIYYNLPIVSSNLGAIPDMVIHNKTGFLHHPNDIDGISESLLKLLQNKTLTQEFALLAKEHISNKYSWESVVIQMTSKIRNYIKE